MIRLSDIFVKNKETGKKYDVKKVNPEKHEFAWDFRGSKENPNPFQKEKPKSKLKEEQPHQKEMIDGIVDMLNQVDDIRNRKEIALDRLKDFHKEGIKLNVKDFLNRIGLSSITERHKSTPNERISKYKERIKNLQDKISKATDKNSDAVKLQKNQVKVIQQTMNNFKQAQTLKKQKSVGGND